MNLLKWFKKPIIDDNYIINEIKDDQISIRNGVGYGFVSDDELYDNAFLEIGFGLIISGYGDWGGGASRSYSSLIKLVVDKDLNIIKKRVDSFYNSRDDREIKAKKLLDKLGDKLILNNEILRNNIESLLLVIPCRSHIGHTFKISEGEDSYRMLKYYIDNTKKPYLQIKKSKWKK